MRIVVFTALLVVLTAGCLGTGPDDGALRNGESSGAVPTGVPGGDGEFEDTPAETPGEAASTPVETETPVPTEEGKEPERIVLTLPFAPEDDPYDLLPMGETVSHDGDPHVGIDFFWNREVDLVASAPGEIIYVEQRTEGHVGTWDVFVRTGEYTVGYTEMGKVNPELEVGDRVERGEYLGTNWNAIPEDDHWMIHWEFGYHSEGWRNYSEGNRVPHPRRLCPTSYFTDESRNRIQTVWDNVTWVQDGVDYKERFPYICSGVFRGKDE